MSKPKKSTKWVEPPPTNQFVATVDVAFPTDQQRHNVLRWFNLQNCGRETIPLSEKCSAKHIERTYALFRQRRYQFVFEIDAEGDWKFIGRKA